MELRAYKCEYCGSTTLVSSTERSDTLVCAYCGTRYKEISADDNLGLGVAHLKNGRYQTAGQFFGKHVDRNPNDYRGYLGLTLVQYCTGVYLGDPRYNTYNTNKSIIQKYAPKHISDKVNALTEYQHKFHTTVVRTLLPYIERGTATKKLRLEYSITKMETEPDRQIMLEAYTELYGILKSVLRNPKEVNAIPAENLVRDISNIEERYKLKNQALKEEIENLEQEILMAKRNRRTRFIKHFFLGLVIGALCSLILYFPMCWIFSSAIDRYAPKIVFVIGLYVISVIAVWYKFDSESQAENNYPKFDVQNRKEKIQLLRKGFKVNDEQCRIETKKRRDMYPEEEVRHRKFLEDTLAYLKSAINLLTPAEELFNSLIKDIQA